MVVLINRSCGIFQPNYMPLPYSAERILLNRYSDVPLDLDEYHL